MGTQVPQAPLADERIGEGSGISEPTSLQSNGSCGAFPLYGGGRALPETFLVFGGWPAYGGGGIYGGGGR